MEMHWSLFEKSVFNYLEKNVAGEDLYFKHSGSSDSTKGDIEVFYKKIHRFNIECKKDKSQSSQFVLHINKDKKIFSFSKKNKSSSLKAEAIVEHMNNNFNYYTTLNKSMKLNNKLICDKDILYKFVIDNLITKGSRFIATARNLKEHNNIKNLIFLPIWDLENYFDIVGTYRTKRSGSNDPTKENLISFPYETIEIGKSKKKYFVYDKNSEIPKIIGENFFLAKVDPSSGLRRVRFRGKTQNHNVIFSLYLKNISKNNNTDNYIKKLISQEINISRNK